MGVNSLPKTVTRQRRGCDLNPGLCAPESSTLTTRLPSHLLYYSNNRIRQVAPVCAPTIKEKKEAQFNKVLAASNLDPAALSAVTRRLEALAVR